MLFALLPSVRLQRCRNSQVQRRYHNQILLLLNILNRIVDMFVDASLMTLLILHALLIPRYRLTALDIRPLLAETAGLTPLGVDSLRLSGSSS